MLQTWLARAALLTLAVVGSSHSATTPPTTSPFYAVALEKIYSNEFVEDSLTYLYPVSRGDDMPPILVDQGACSRKPSLSTSNNFYWDILLKSKRTTADWKKYAKGSHCRRRDMLLAYLIDGLTTYLSSINDFSEKQKNPPKIRKETCHDSSAFDQFLNIFRSKENAHTLRMCSSEFFDPPFATQEQYTEAMKALDTSMTKIYDIIDGWVCRHKMTDKSMTYFTLFKRKAEDIRARDDPERTPILHFLEDYPKRLDAGLRGLTGAIGEPATKLIQGLIERAAASKDIMKTMGIDEKERTQEQNDHIKAHCEPYRRILSAAIKGSPVPVKADTAPVKVDAAA
ncbi:hypothetical protein TWF730_000697 [Orbilia blumenaviensis]|uniref:Uncharacterized protein n=1 Tax=Orbilia blumenaviensis TaxID=1796055 RepID=A0AAV9VTK2_9PEZI